MHIAILGGGISGLSVAWHLARRSFLRGWPTDVTKITLLDSAANLGGNIKTFRAPDGSLLEAGPRSLRPSGPQGLATLELIDQLDLTDEVIVAGPDHPAAKNRFIYTDGALHRLPSDIWSLLRGGLVPSSVNEHDSLLAPMLLKSIAGEIFSKPPPKGVDESIFDFVQRHLGKDVAESVVDPFCLGIFGGNAKKLSLQSCLPSLAKMEESSRSLLLGALLTKSPAVPHMSNTILSEKVEDARIWTLRNGLGSLIEKLEEKLTGFSDLVEVHKDSRCTALVFPSEGGVEVQTESQGSINVDRVVSTLPAHALAQVIGNKDFSDIYHTLREIPFLSVNVISMVYNNIELPVEGFGYLIPSKENEDILGIVFDSCSFPEQDGKREDASRLTVMSGGEKFDGLYGGIGVQEASEVASRIAKAACASHLNINCEPSYVQVTPWLNCFPQYTPGHRDRLLKLSQALKESLQGRLIVTGSSYNGVGVNDCVMSARAVAHKVLYGL